MGGCLASPSRAPLPGEEEADEPPLFMASRSPRCVAFQSQKQNDLKRSYLCYDYDSQGGGGIRPLLRLDGEGVGSPHTRFYMEPSREHQGLVHIRCCYDNRYWAAQQRPHDGAWVVGGADEAEEDLSFPTCTLFRPMRVRPSASPSIRLLHVHMEKYVCLPACSSDSNMIKLEAVSSLSLPLQKGDDEAAALAYCTYTVHDLSQQFTLPRYVAFKGDNGMYLRVRTQERHDYLQFSGRDIRDQTVLNTVHTNGDGTFRVMSNYVGKFWRRSPNWIWADSDGDGDGDGDGDILFRAIRLSGSAGGSSSSFFFFALRNLGNDFFCKRLTTEGKRNCLNAGVPTIATDARLQLEEAVVSREIFDVVFDLSSKPRIYGKSVVTMATAFALNASTANNTATLAMEYTSTEKTTWGSSVTLKLAGVTTSISTGVPVIIADGSIEVSSEFTGPYAWGSTVDKETTQKVSYQVTVPPKTRVTVSSTATRASCDIPFSYMQKDILFDGKEFTSYMEDGLYTGVSFYDFKFVTGEENL